MISRMWGILKIEVFSKSRWQREHLKVNPRHKKTGWLVSKYLWAPYLLQKFLLMSSCGWGACYMGRVEGLKERLHCMVFNCLHHIPQIQLLRTYLLYFKDSESLVKNRTLPYLFFLFFFKGNGGLPLWLNGKESSCQCRRHIFDPWSGRSHAFEQLSPYITTIEPVL